MSQQSSSLSRQRETIQDTKAQECCHEGFLSFNKEHIFRMHGFGYVVTKKHIYLDKGQRPFEYYFYFLPIFDPFPKTL